jgi:hypothetical protein
MATVVWQGNAPAVAQVSTFTVQDTWATGDTATLTCGSAFVTFTVAGVETVSAVVAGLVALWNASAAPELFELTAFDADPDIRLTSKTAGIPFTVTGSETNAGDGTIDAAQTDTTPNSGPNVWDTAANWSGGAVPVDDDDIVIENSAVSILYGIDQSAVTPTSFTVKSTFTNPGHIGLPRTNSNDTSNPYVEYRPTYLKFCDAGDATDTAIDIGYGDGAGSGRIKLDTNTGEITMNVWKTGVRVEAGVPSLLWKGTHVDNGIYLNRADMGVAIFAGESAAFRDLSLGFMTTQATDVNLRMGASVTHKAGNTIFVNGGVFSTLSNLINLQVLAGDATVGGGATITLIDVRGGTYHWNNTGAVGTMDISDDAVITFTGDMQTKTLTTANIYGGTIIDPAGKLPEGATLECFRVALSDVYQGPAHQDWTRAAK